MNKASRRTNEQTERMAETADTLAMIGRRIKQVRTQKKLTLQAVAEKTGLSVSMLSLVERGRASPSIGTLVSISSALEVHMSDLVSGKHRNDRRLVSRVHEQPVIETAEGVVRRILRDDEERGVEIAINEYAPNTGSATIPMSHNGFEYGILLEGALTVEVGGETNVVNAGDLISYPSTRPHRLWNYGDTVARALWINMDDNWSRAPSRRPH